MSSESDKLRIVFMGTPDFAVASLSALLEARYDIVGVVTAPDKPAGRGMKLQSSAVKQFAESKGLHVLQPFKLKDENFLQELKKFTANLQVVVAFRMLPEVVWNMPPLGTINLHASLLPKYRGAAPINWAIINGETETGVTTFKLKQEIDTGNILRQETISIGENETAGELHDKMKTVGAGLLVQTVEAIAAGTLQEKDQSELLQIKPVKLVHAPKIFTETSKIDWNKFAGDVHNLIRGLSPYPGAFCYLNEKMFKIFRSTKELINHSYQAGSVQTDNKSFLKFACRDGFVHALEVQFEGKKKMNIESFLRGYKISPASYNI